MVMLLVHRQISLSRLLPLASMENTISLNVQALSHSFIVLVQSNVVKIIEKICSTDVSSTESMLL